MPIDTSGETRDNETRVPPEPAETEYLDWGPAGSPVSIHMHMGAVDGITRDVMEGLGNGPRRDVEVGGLLLGRVESGSQYVVWIERYQRISCSYTYGPHFVLDAADTTSLEEAATSIFDTRDMAVVGLYRSHIRQGLQLEEADFDLIRRYFSDPSDLILLVKPGKGNTLFAQFYRYDRIDGAQPVGEQFPFRGHVVASATRMFIPDPQAPEIGGPESSAPAHGSSPDDPPSPDTARTMPPVNGIEHLARAEEEDQQVAEEPPTGRQPLPITESSGAPGMAPPETPLVREFPRRLVPDFSASQPSAPVEPSPSLYGLGDPDAPPAEHWQRPAEVSKNGKAGNDLKKWLPLLAALLLVGGIVWFFVAPGRNSGSATTATQQIAAAARPLGLYVEPLTQTIRVLWNPNATALRDARNVQLFVREGDDQTHVNLPARDLAAGSYEYPSHGNDVTFRLEVTARNGQVTAESFRLQRRASGGGVASAKQPGQLPSGASRSVTPPPPAPAAAPVVSNTPEPVKAEGRTVQPKPTYRAPPVIAAGIRPRIKGAIPIDVRVKIDERGRVASASLVTKLHSGLEEYLGSRAVTAARQWRFEPARENGKAVAGTQSIHFVFTR
jgi:TonB family protein